MHEPLLIDSSGLGTMLVFHPILHMVIQLVEEKSTNLLFFVVEVFGGDPYLGFLIFNLKQSRQDPKWQDLIANPLELERKSKGSQSEHKFFDPGHWVLTIARRFRHRLHLT